MKPARRSTGTFGLQARLSARRRAIKAAWNATGLDDAAYRTMLMSVAGVASSLNLDLAGADRVLNHINKSLGRTVETRKGEPAKVRPECAELLTKIEALLADMKLPWAYGSKILKNNGADRWEWATPEQLRAVIAALVVEQDKRQLETAVVAALEAIGRDRTAAPTLARAFGAKKPANWNRDRDTMRAMLAHLHRTANIQQAPTLAPHGADAAPQGGASGLGAARRPEGAQP